VKAKTSNVITLPNGIRLDPDWGFAPSIAGHAREKGFGDIRCFAAIEPGDTEPSNYVLVRGTEAIYENTSAEAMFVRIAMMAADRDMP
jgi:hypothetical protein